MPAMRRGVAVTLAPAPIPADLRGVIPGPASLGVLVALATLRISWAFSLSSLRVS